MQDIISTLKNALQQAEAGLEVAVGRLAKDGKERGDFKPSEVLALACVREALAMPVTCLHQIQEPAAAEQGAGHAGLDEGRAQAAPAAVAVPDERAAFEAWSSARYAEINLARDGDEYRYALAKDWWPVWKASRAALAATPAVAPARLVEVSEVVSDRGGIKVTRLNLSTEGRRGLMCHASEIPGAAAPVVLPEPAYTLRVRGVFQDTTPTAQAFGMPDGEHKLFTEQQLRALLATATGLPAQAVPALFSDEDRVLVPRGLLGAACCAIDKKRDSIKTLAELRRYTTGDLSAAAPAVGEPVASHGDDVAVDALTTLMKAKLAKQRDKGYGGWDDSECTREWLSQLLREHVDKGDPVDVANFCAFLSARGEGIAPQAQADARDAEIQQAVQTERERICAAIKAEDDHCVTQGDYMLDSDDCIKVARGEWVRPVYDAAIAAAKGE